MADALDFEASNRKCGACGETGHNARTCKSKTIPFSTGGFWNEKSFDGLEQLGLPFVDASHVAMISKIVDGEVLKEPNSRAAIPRMTWDEEPITMTRGELDEMCKAGDLISIGESRYSCSYLRGALAYLPKNTVLTCYTGYHYPLKATFEYGGEEWIFFLAPRVENWYAESFEAVVVNRGPQPKGAVAKTMMNHAMMEKAKIEEMIHELENKVRLGIISEDQLMKHLEKKFGADYEITISDEDMEKIAKSQGRTKEELETYWEQYENTTDVEVTDYYEEFKRKHPEMHEKFVDRLSREDYWYGDYKTNLFAKRKELKEMGLDFDMIDRYWEMNDERIPERVTCSACDGEGIIITKYYPATREDPADADYVDCEMCDGEGTYLDGVFEAENEQEWINAHKEYAPTEMIIKRLKESGVWELGDDPYAGSSHPLKWWGTVKIKDGTLVRATEDDFGDLTAINIILIADEMLKGYGRVTVSYTDVDNADWEDSFNDEMVKLGKEITTIFINNGMFHSGDDLEYGDMGEFYNVVWGDEIRHDCATNADLDIYEDDFIVMECNICGKTATYRQETSFYGPRNAETFEAETKKRKTGFRKCSKCGYSDHNSSNCNRLDEYEAYRKHKDEMLKECDDAIQRFTRSAKRYSEDGEYGLAKMLRSDATDMKKLKRMIENNHFGKAVHFAMCLDSDPRESAPSALWMFDAEEVKLSKTSCCCGATESNPCACMKAPKPMNCSATEPKCQCYKDLEKTGQKLHDKGLKDEDIGHYTPLQKEVNKYGLSIEMSKDDLYARKLKRLKDGFTKKNAETFEEFVSGFPQYNEGNLICQFCNADIETETAEIKCNSCGNTILEVDIDVRNYEAETFEAEYPKYREYKGVLIERTAKNRAKLVSDMWDMTAKLYKPRKKENWILQLTQTHPQYGDRYKTEVKNFTDGLNLYIKLSDLSKYGAETFGAEGDWEVCAYRPNETEARDARNQMMRAKVGRRMIRYDYKIEKATDKEGWYVLHRPRTHRAETYNAEEKGKRKIGETVAWNNSIIGMDGKWRNGKYDLYEIGNQIGYVVVHQDIDNFEYEIQEKGVLLGSKGTDVAQISFAGLNIYTGSDGSFPVVGLYERIVDYYSRTQNKPKPIRDDWEEIEDYEKSKYLEQKWEDEFTEWAKTVYDFEPQYYTDGTEVPLSYYVAKDLLQEDHKLLVGARVSISNPSMPNLELRDSKSSVWVLEYPNLTDLTQGQYRQIRRGTNEVFVNTEKTVDKIFANLQKKYPQGMISAYDGGWRRTKSFSMTIPDFGQYMWTATERKLVYDSLSDEEKKRKEKLERDKRQKEYEQKQKEKQDALKAKYGAESDFKMYYLVEMPQRDYLDNFPTLEDAQFAWKELPHRENFIIVERNPMKNKEKEMPRFGAEEGDDCPNCHCEHQNLSLDGTPDVDEEYVSVNVVCDDCGMKGYTTTYPYEWDDEAKLQEVGLPLAVNMQNPNYGELRCSRCYQRFEKSAENYFLDVE